jgi:hypothetical protein
MLADDVTTVNFRVPRSDRDAFWAKASAYGTPSHVLRELVMAYIDGRLIIEPRTIEIQ